MRKYMLWITVSIISILAILFYRLSLKNSHIQNKLSHTEISQAAYAFNHSLSLFSFYNQGDLHIHCEFKIDQKNQLLVNEQTKNCFEYVITQDHSSNISQIKSNFKRYITENYTEPAISQILSLWNRYYQYRIRLGSLHLSENKQTIDTQYYHLVFNAIQKLRLSFFSTYEIQALFRPEENMYHFYILHRMDILTNKKLTEKEKAQQLHQLFKSLPQKWQTRFGQPYVLQDLQELTADIQARGGNEKELNEMRLNLLGAETFQHLETLDQHQNLWGNRVNRYLKERERILHSNMEKAVKNIVIQHLREQYFKIPAEKTRITAFEYKYDQSHKLSVIPKN